MSDLMEIVDKLEEINEAERELLVLMSGAQKTCALLFILHTQREEAFKDLNRVIETGRNRQEN